MEIVTLPIASLKMHKDNAKLHPKEQVEQIKESIKLYGFNDPIGIWGKSNTIVEGHGRYMAAKELGIEQVPCIRLDHLSDKQRREYMLVHNQTTMNSGWDLDLLADELEGLDFDGFDFGFDLGEDEKPTEVTEDEYDAEPPAEPKAKLGDIYQLGRHRLMCGDSTNRSCVERLMDGQKADMVFTDPPYNIASDSRNYAASGKTTKKTYETLAKSEWDKNFNIKPALENLSEFSKDDCVAYICTSQFLIQTILDWAEKYYDFNNYIVWCKPNPTPSLSKRHWTFATELIVYATRGKWTCNFPSRKNFLNFYGYDEAEAEAIDFAPEMNYWILNKEQHTTSHPTQKPVKLCGKPIGFSSRKQDVVLDLFGGSGSTLIACEQLDRICYMMELDPRYVDVIIDRWEKFTGEKAVKLN